MTKDKGKSVHANIMDAENAAGVIKFISQKSEVVLTELQDIIPNFYRAKNTMKELVDSGLVEERFERRPKVTYHYTLTEKGEKVAQKLREIDEIINS